MKYLSTTSHAFPLPRTRACVPLIAAAALFVCAAQAIAEPDLSTPQKAMDACGAAFYNGDAAVLRAAAIFPPGSDQLFDAFIARGKARAAARDAIAKQFGRASLADFPALSDAPPPFKTKWQVIGNKAKLVGAEEGDHDLPPVATFVKTDGKWQQELTDAAEPKAQRVARVSTLDLETRVIAFFAKQVAGGELKDASAASAAWSVRTATLAGSGNGDVEATNRVAGWFQYGINVDADAPTALALYIQAANAGHAPSMSAAGNMYRNGEGTKENPAEAVKYYQRAAKKQDAEGLRQLGRCCQKGYGVPKDPAKGLDLLLDAETEGSDEALIDLGDTYRDGIGVPSDDARAAKLYAKAADKLKSAYAMCEVAATFERRSKSPADAEQAVAWYTKAALTGDSTGMIRLARHLESGDGCQKDPDQARTWYEKAANAGDEKAKNWLNAHPADGT